jgi:hypothetical protein
VIFFFFTEFENENHIFFGDVENLISPEIINI